MDPLSPETRLSLLNRLRDSSDEVAWGEFVELYTPAIYRTARIIGLQDVDAQDVTQQVLISVARALEQRPHDAERAKFRTWLSRVTRNATLNALTRVRPDRGNGGPEQNRLLANVTVEESQNEAEILEREYQRELFNAAAKEVESQVAPDTWQAFWLTTIEGQEIADVAKKLGKSVGTVYAARSRIVRRMRELVESLNAVDEGELDPPGM